MADKTQCGICAAIQRIRAGQVPDFVAEFPNCLVVLGESQSMRGYCVAFAKQHATELHLMPGDSATALFREIVILGNAVANVVKPVKLNYECLGNQEPHVHWHVFPRFANEPSPKRPVWETPELLVRYRLQPDDERTLIAQLRSELGRLCAAAAVEIKFS